MWPWIRITFTHPKSGQTMDFVHWARTEGRFSKHFDGEGRPSLEIQAVGEERLRNWHLLQELAGLR